MEPWEVIKEEAENTPMPINGGLKIIRAVMENCMIDVEDIIEDTNADIHDVLRGFSDWEISDYCEENNIDITVENDYVDDEECDADMDPDDEMLGHLWNYCSERHRMVDFDSVIDDIRELLTKRGFDKRLLNSL